MELVLREIKVVQNGQINVTIPDTIKTKRVEVIVIPYIDPKNEIVKKVDFENYFGISDVGEKRINSYLNETRNEWDRKVSD
jgi:hypothetical protein